MLRGSLTLEQGMHSTGATLSRADAEEPVADAEESIRPATDGARYLLTWRWYAAIAAIYLAGVGILAPALRHNLGFPLDDSWIHQEVARNLVEHHSLGFTPGVTSSGSSSTLWSLILCINYLLLPGHSPVVFPLVLNTLLLMVSGVLIWRMAILDGLPLLYALALGLLPALSGNYVWLAFIGMEHVLFVTLSLAAILLWVRTGYGAEGDAGARHGGSLAAGVALGALGMTRPEGLALCALLFVLYRVCGRSFADVLRAAGVALLFLVPAFAINLKTSGSLLPETLRGRLFLYFSTDKLHIGISTVLSLTRDIYGTVIKHNFFDTTTRNHWPLLFVLPAGYGCVVLLRRFPNRTSILMLWALLHFAMYCLTLPASGHGGRYQPFVLMLFPALLAIGLLDLMGDGMALAKSGSAPLRPAQAAALVAVAALTAATLPRWQVALHDSIYNIDNCHLKMAEYIDAHYPPGTKMGVFDIGTIGYFSHIDLLDLGGLVDRTYLPYVVAGRVPEYLEERGADYVVLAHNGPEGDHDGTGPQNRLGDELHFYHNPTLRLEEIHSEGIDYQTWHSSYLYTQHAYRYQTLYRIVRLNPDGMAAGAAAF